MQVGDKLSAVNTAKLAEALAAKLTATSFSSNSDSDPMLGTMLLLSRNMQQLVFRKMGQITAPRLFKWPPPLQQVRSSYSTIRATSRVSEQPHLLCMYLASQRCLLVFSGVDLHNY